MQHIKLTYPANYTGFAEYPNGLKVWRLDGQNHRVDGPAIERSDGEKQWWLNGKLHREDGPAIEYVDGSKSWYRNGKLHREDGPAIEYVDGSKQWFLNGQRHRIDGPAIEYSFGTKYWYLNNKRIYRLEPIGEYILIEDGLPSEVEWLGKRVTQRKVLTATGFMYIPNLPGI